MASPNNAYAQAQGARYNLAGEKIGVIQGTTTPKPSNHYMQQTSSHASQQYSSFKQVALDAPYIFGKVTDMNGRGVPNVEIYEASSGKKVYTSGSAYFNITIPAERHVYVYIKYEGKTIDDRQMWLKNGELREVNVIVPPYLLQKEEPVFVMNRPLPKPKTSPKPPKKKPVVKRPVPKVVLPPKPVKTKPIMPPPSKWPRAKKPKPKPKPAPEPVIVVAKPKPKPRPKPKPPVVVAKPKPAPAPEPVVVIVKPKPKPKPPQIPSKMTFYVEEMATLQYLLFDGEIEANPKQATDIATKTLNNKAIRYNIRELVTQQMKATLKKRDFRKWKKAMKKEGWIF